MKKRMIILTAIFALFLISLAGFFTQEVLPENNKDKNNEAESENLEIQLPQEAVVCAFDLYNKARAKGIALESQCLGTCGDYAVDIVHIPRIEEDNLEKNQCPDFLAGKVSHFIELDRDRNIFRIW